VAASPDRSVWVSANAGSGKTYVLATRVIRLLLAGTDPSRILCLTYTKTAAAEMKERVFRRLGEWVTMPEADLREALVDLEGRTPDAAKIAFARCLFARALETPGGLKIQTIHAFCDALLHRFPLEANVPGHFEQLDEDMIAALIGEARAEMLARIDRGDGGNVTQAFRTIIDLAGESGLDALLDEAVQNRSKLTACWTISASMTTGAPSTGTMFGFREGDTPEALRGRGGRGTAAAWPRHARCAGRGAGFSRQDRRRNFAETFLDAVLACGLVRLLRPVFHQGRRAALHRQPYEGSGSPASSPAFEAAHDPPPSPRWRMRATASRCSDRSTIRLPR
jgi:hypothetical protein